MSSIKVWRRLLSLALPLRRGLLLSLLLGALTIGAGVALMATSAWLISKAAVAQSIGELGVAVVAVRFFGISRGVFRYLERLVSHGQTFTLLAHIRVWFYQAIEPLAPAGLTRHHSGDLLDRVVADVETLQDVFLRTLAPPLVALLGGTTAVVLFCGFDPALGLTLTVFLIAGGVGVPLLAWKWSQSTGAEQVTTRAALNARLIDTVQGMADLVAFGAESAQIAALDTLNAQLLEQDRRMARIDGAQSALNLLVVNLATLAVLTVAIPRVDSLHLAALTLATVAAFEAITPLAAAAQTIGAVTAAARRLFEIADQPAPVEPGTSPNPSRFGLSVCNLSFRYGPNGPLVLHNLSFDVPEGHTLAIVGASGAGKSTLVNLLLRFYDTGASQITLGGQPLSTYRHEDLYRLIAVVSQRTYLFNVSIGDNLRLAQPDATDDTLIEAARRAQIHDFIQSLPAGYETLIGEAGVHLSGGERQRIAIARALLRNAPILLFDEPTAGLDMITERRLMAGLHEAMLGRTTLIITHRLPTIVDADEILVLDGGREVERGTHSELLRQDGVYHRMWRLQADVLVDSR